MTTYHKHHIIPRHMGGSDDPSNIIELTIEEHANAHKQLYEQYGHKEDYLAWKGLSGKLGKEEILAEKEKIRIQKVKKRMKELVDKGEHIFQNKELSSFYNVKRIEEGTHNFLDPEFRKWHKTHLSNVMKEKAKNGLLNVQNPEFIERNKPRKRQKELKNINEGKHNFQKKLECPHCGRLGTIGPMTMHIKSCKKSLQHTNSGNTFPIRIRTTETSYFDAGSER